MTMIGSAVGGVITMLIALLGWIGVAKFQDFKQQVDEASHLIQAQLQAAQADAKHINDYAEQVRKIENQQQVNTGKLQKIAKVMTPLIDPLHNQIKEEIHNKNPSRVNDLYDDIQEVKNIDETELSDLLNLIEPAIFEEPKDATKEYRTEYSELLLKILRDISTTPLSKIKAYYLLLANAILNDQKEFDHGQKFETVLADFERYARQNKGIRVDRKEVTKLDDVFQKETQDKRTLFERVKRIIPTRSGTQ
jgi:hypothetical protein